MRKTRILPNTDKFKLKPAQLERAQNLSGEGQASTYNDVGEKSFKAIKGLAKARSKAGRFVLYTPILGKYIFVAKEQPDPTIAPLTTNLEEALEFYEGFDNPETKAKYWEAELRKFSHSLSIPLKHAKRYGKNQIKEQ